jgi:hypothetical protein
MAENPVLVDPNAFRAPIPQAPQPVDVSPIAAGLGKIGETAFQLGQALYQQDQHDRVIRAQLHIASGMEQLRLQAGQERNLDNIIPAFNTGAEQLQAQAMAFAQDEHTRTAIGFEFQRAKRTTEAHIFPDVMRQRAGTAHANILTLNERVFQAAAAFPSGDMTPFKEQVGQLADQLVLSGAARRDTARAWELAQRERLDFMKADQAISNSPMIALQQLRARETGDPGAPFSNYTDLLERRNVLIERAMAAAKQKAVNISLDVRQGVTAILGGQRDAVSNMNNLIANGATPEQQAEASADFTAATMAKNSVDRMAIATPAEQAKITADFYAKALDPANPAAVRVIGPFTEQVRAIEHDWQTDPASAADRYFPAKLPNDATLADRMDLRKSAFAVKGLPSYTPLLTQAEVANTIKTFTEMSQVDQKPAYARAILGSMGIHAEEGMGQLLAAKMPPGFVKMADPGMTPYAAAQLAAAISIPIAEQRKRYGGDPTVATGLERDALTKYNDGPAKSFPTADPGQIANNAQLTAQMALQVGDAQKAYDLLWGADKYVAVNGGESRLRIPPGVDGTMVKSQAERILTDAIGADGAVIRQPLPSGIPGVQEVSIRHELLTDLPTADMRKRELQAHGGWLTYSGPNGRDDGIVLTVYGRPAVDKNGQDIRFTWLQLQDYGARAVFEKETARLEASRRATAPRPEPPIFGPR